MNGPRTIDELYAYIVVADDGSETVPAVQLSEWDGTAGPVVVPLMAADSARAHGLRQYILTLPELRGKTLWLTKFTGREVVEVLKR